MKFTLTPLKIKLRENHVEKACLDLLAYKQYKVHRNHTGRAQYPDGTWITLEPKGTPDYVCVHGKHLSFYLEVKAPGRHLSNEQLIKISQLTLGYGLTVATVSSVEELSQWLTVHESKGRLV